MIIIILTALFGYNFVNDHCTLQHCPKLEIKRRNATIENRGCRDVYGRLAELNRNVRNKTEVRKFTLYTMACRLPTVKAGSQY